MWASARARLTESESRREAIMCSGARSASVVTQMTSKWREWERASLRPGLRQLHSLSKCTITNCMLWSMSRFMADYRIARPSSSSSTPPLAKLMLFHADIQISGRVAFYARIRTYFIPTFVFLSPSLAMKRQTRPRTLALSACEMILEAPIWKREHRCAQEIAGGLSNWCSWILEHYCVFCKVLQTITVWFFYM